MLVHSASTIRKHSIHLLVSIVPIFNFQLWTQDVSEAYLQSGGGLTREVSFREPGKFQQGPDHLLKALKPLYGLTDSGDYWQSTLMRNLWDDLTMKPTIGYLSLLTSYEGNVFSAVTRTYANDTMSAGNKILEDQSNVTARNL